MKREELKKYYQDKEVIDTYDNQRLATDYRKFKRKKELEIFLLLLGKKEGEKVLEIGCSSGFLTQNLGRVTAIDTSKKMLEQTKIKNPKAKVLEADMFKLPFRDNSFNKIVTMRVWNHLDRKDFSLILKEAKRVLKKRGIIVFDMEERSLLRRIVHFFYKKLFKIKGFKIYQYSLREIIFILDEEGFSMIKGRHLNHKIGRQMIIKAQKD